MSTFANRHNNSASAPMSESDNDDDNEQNSSFNHQNESMMHKVKDVVSKLLHPSFLFAPSGDTTRPKRKRAISIEENGVEKQPETITTTTNTTSNGHSTISKSKYHRRPITDDEPQLTDDEDSNGRDVSPTEQDLTGIEQQKKRRRTANYQHIISTTTTNGTHEDERTSAPLTSVNSAGSLSNRRIIDNGSNTANTTPVLLLTSIEQNPNEGTNRSTSFKQRFDISSTNRGLIPNYDPSQSPFFSVGVRETTMSPNRTTTNLKSNANEFSANYLLATGLVNRSQPTTQNTQQCSSTSTNRLSSIERQMFGGNYAPINSRRLPYIERLRRRTLQDCIRLNRTLDSEPLSISTIEEHTSTTASPIRKPIKASEKECGIQCNISTTDSSMEPNKKIQRTFPPADIRNEALSVPNIEKVQPTSQIYSSIQTNSSITIEPIKPTNDITKSKVLGNVTPFSWPNFARAQEEYAKKYTEKCRVDAVPTEPSKPTVSSIVEKSNVNITPSIGPEANTSSTISKVPIFGVSPPRPTKPVTGPIWKCPSCTMEHPVQTASCSLCHGINPNYKRLSAIEPTPPPVSSNKTPDTIVENSTVPTPVTTTQTTVQIESTPIVTSPPTTTKESTFSIPPLVTITAPFTTTSTLPLFGTIPTTTKENIVINPPVTTSAPFPSTTIPLFGTITATLDKPVTSTPNNLFQINTSTPPTFQSFGSLTPINTTTATSTSTAPSIITTTTTTSSSSIKVSTSITFGSFGSAPLTKTTATTTVSSTVSSDRPPLFSFGTGAPTLSITPSSLSTTAITSSTTPSLFAFPSNATAPTTTTASSLTFPVSTTISGFSFPSSFPLVSTSIAITTNTATTSAVPLFGTSLSSSGFSFPSASTTTTTSSSTPFAFGASSPPKPFAPSVISTSNATSSPAFGATASFGAAPTTMDKPPTSVPSFSAFGSTSNTSSLFAFGATSNTTTNPIQTSAAPAGTTSGFPFSSSSTAAAPPAFGSAPSTFAFGGTPSFSFGAGSTAPTSSAPFQFSAVPPTATVNNAFSVSFPPTVSTPENNPFNYGDDSTNKRPVIKAKRRANKP